ncbi:alpha/beta fold hydrolase [Actinomadura scrupuli]|uniref:alpha/beta fold hydrolase n=1 Tax=Actinomadura scrupuli TaxID=559629 RepID=UPI003D98741E
MNLPQTVREPGGERIVHANGVELCVQTFGERGDPAILLLGGASSSMEWWEEEFCLSLAGGGRFVIRYDHRDTGRSTSYEPGSPLYGFEDLAADAVGLLDCLGVERVHLVGISMGGGIGQRLALDHGPRVASLTLISTSPGLRPGAPPGFELPPPSAALRAHFAAPAAAPDWTDRAAVIDSIVAGRQLFAGSTGSTGSEQARFRQLAARVVDRTTDIAASMTNHWMIDPGAPYGSRLGQITAATLVIHGTEDPLFPYEHAEASAREIAGAQLLALDGVGHQMPPARTWEVVIPALLRHTGGSRDAQSRPAAAE